MPIDSNTLLQEANCYTCLGISTEQAMTLALERRWLLSLDPSADTSRQGLLNDASCLACYGMSEFDILEIEMLSQISFWNSAAGLAVTDFIARAGITDPAQIEAIVNLVDSAVLNGWWDKCDLIYPFVGGTAGAHAQNLKSSSFTITWAGTVTHNANGITGNGTDGYGDTTYNIASSGQIVLNSAHLAVYRRTIGSGAGFKPYIGATTVIGTACQLLLRIPNGGSTTASVVANDNTVELNSPTSLGLLMGSRFDSAQKHLFTGASDFTLSTNSVAVPNLNVFILARNLDGAPSAFSASQLAGATVGSGITFSEYQLMAADWQAFQAALGRAV